MDRSFAALFSRSNKDGANIKIDESFEAEDIGLQGKDIAEYVTRPQNLDREERAAWRVAQKFYAEEKKRADEIRMAEIQTEEKKRDEIWLAQIEIEKELKIKEMELQAQ